MRRESYQPDPESLRDRSKYYFDLLGSSMRRLLPPKLCRGPKATIAVNAITIRVSFLMKAEVRRYNKSVSHENLRRLLPRGLSR